MPNCIIFDLYVLFFWYFDWGRSVIFFDINIFFEKWNFLGGGKIRKHGKWAKSKNPPQYLCACSFYLTFKTSLGKKYWEMREEIHFMKKNIFEEKCWDVRDSPKMGKGRKIWFLEINRKRSHGHFKPSLGCFGWVKNEGTA